MRIAGMDEVLARALHGGYAVGYFEAWDPYSLEAVIEAVLVAVEKAVVVPLGVVSAVEPAAPLLWSQAR